MSVIQKLRGRRTADGAGAEPIRLFPNYSLVYIDPFVMLDHFSIQKPAGFPDHPHRGFEILTYVLEGAVAHKDSAGHARVIHQGDVQKITAGRGIVHAEMPGSDGVNSGLQLWINLPRAEKGVDPAYQDFRADELPLRTQDGVTIRTLVGPGSPIQLRRPMVYYDFTQAGGACAQVEQPQGFQGFIYVLSGQGVFDQEKIEGEEGDLLVLAQAESPLQIPVQANAPLRFVFVAGEPIGERPRYNGPFVD